METLELNLGKYTGAFDPYRLPPQGAEFRINEWMLRLGIIVVSNNGIVEVPIPLAPQRCIEYAQKTIQQELNERLIEDRI